MVDLDIDLFSVCVMGSGDIVIYSGVPRKLFESFSHSSHYH